MTPRKTSKFNFVLAMVDAAVSGINFGAGFARHATFSFGVATFMFTAGLITLYLYFGEKSRNARYDVEEAKHEARMKAIREKMGMQEVTA